MSRRTFVIFHHQTTSNFLQIIAVSFHHRTTTTALEHLSLLLWVTKVLKHWKSLQTSLLVYFKPQNNGTWRHCHCWCRKVRCSETATNPSEHDPQKTGSSQWLKWSKRLAVLEYSLKLRGTHAVSIIQVYWEHRGASRMKQNCTWRLQEQRVKKEDQCL